MALVGWSGQRLDITKKNFTHITYQAVVGDSLILRRWGKIYSNHLEYILPLGDDDDKIVTFQEYLATIKLNTVNHKGDQLFHALY